MRVANVRTGGVLLVALVLVLVGCSVAIPPPDPSSPRASSSPSVRSNRSETEPTPEPEVTPSTPDEPPDAIDVHALAFADADHGVLVGGAAWDSAVGVAWSTADGGKTWSKRFTGTAPLDAVAIVGRTTVLAATACDGNAGAACQPGLFRRGLGGVAWTPLSAEPLTFLSFPSKTTGWGISGRSQTTGPADGGRLVRTTDGGSTWEPLGISCPATTGRPIAVSFPDLEHGWVACNATFGAGNATKAILRTADGGATWTVMASAPVPGHGKDVGQIGTNGYLAGLAMAADGVGMAWMGRGVTARTADGGRTWVDMPPGEWDVREADAGWALNDHDWLLHVLNGAGDQPALEATHDGGRSWSIVAVIPAPRSS